MSAPEVMPDPRQMIHIMLCDTDRKCRYDFGTMHGEASPQCRKLDELLDYNDEMLLHATACQLEDEMRHVSTGRSGAGVASGLYHGARMIDPYTKIDEFTDDPETHFHPGEERPDCSGCVKGIEHYHRKSDGSPVKAPGREQGGA